jgi:hypothetical protein
MSDPSPRRLLDASRNRDIPPHWQIQNRHELRDHEVREVLDDVEKCARRYAEAIGSGFDEQKNAMESEESIQAVLRQANTYDRAVFESMGVKTSWEDEFQHIPAALDAMAV